MKLRKGKKDYEMLKNSELTPLRVCDNYYGGEMSWNGDGDCGRGKGASGGAARVWLGASEQRRRPGLYGEGKSVVQVVGLCFDVSVSFVFFLIVWVK